MVDVLVILDGAERRRRAASERACRCSTALADRRRRDASLQTTPRGPRRRAPRPRSRRCSAGAAGARPGPRAWSRPPPTAIEVARTSLAPGGSTCSARTARAQRAAGAPPPARRRPDPPRPHLAGHRLLSRVGARRPLSTSAALTALGSTAPPAAGPLAAPRPRSSARPAPPPASARLLGARDDRPSGRHRATSTPTSTRSDAPRAAAIDAGWPRVVVHVGGRRRGRPRATSIATRVIGALPTRRRPAQPARLPARRDVVYARAAPVGWTVCRRRTRPGTRRRGRLRAPSPGRRRRAADARRGGARDPAPRDRRHAARARARRPSPAG